MPSAAEIPADTRQSLDSPVTDAARLRVSARGRRRSKLQLLTRANLDGRTKAAAYFDSIKQGVTNDLGGNDRVSTVMDQLIDAFAGIAVQARDLNMRLLLGQKVDLMEQSLISSTLVRLASRIGVERVPKDVTPSLSAYLAGLRAEDEAASEAATDRQG
jgi:hypothetical protein